MFNLTPPNTNTNVVAKDIQEKNDKDFYSTIAGNWFTAKPYGFIVTLTDGKVYTMFLPISPSNLSISTPFATNMIPTLYGTVEEHSDVRYFDISIEGNTGLAPQFSSPYTIGTEKEDDKKTSKTKDKSTITSSGRTSFEVNETIKSDALGGFFSKTIAAVNQTVNKAAEAFTGSNKKNSAGFTADNTGYYAFHSLYKMLLRYKKDASGNGDKKPEKGKERNHPIIFFNFKDGNKYNVVIRNFTMRRSADNPMLYYYSIQMRGYKMTSTGVGKTETADADKLKSLGLDGVNGSTLLGDIKKRANSVKGVLGSAMGGLNVLGR